MDVLAQLRSLKGALMNHGSELKVFRLVLPRCRISEQQVQGPVVVL
jgi:hypothetical protein